MIALSPHILGIPRATSAMAALAQLFVHCDSLDAC